MATAKPRVSVTLEPEMYAVLRELADLNGESLSAVIGGLLDAVAPTVLRVVEAGRQFQTLSEDMKEQVRSTFADAETTLVPAVFELEKQVFALFETPPEATPDPRPVTRGSRPPLKSVSPPKSGPVR